MIVLGSAKLAQERRRQLEVQGVAFFKSEWLETDQDPLLSPTVFLVEQFPDTQVSTHFHGENQFQVFIGGGGKIGPDPLGPVTVHYAGAYTGYGPLVAGPEGIQYFTIRAVYEVGVKTGVEQMVRGPKRHAVSTPQIPTEPSTLAALDAPEVATLIPMGADGVTAQMMRIPAGSTATGLDPATGGGQFYVVVGGELQYQGSTLQGWECLFVSSEEKPIELRAGAGGLEVLCLQLAPKEPVYIAAKAAALAAATA